MAIRSYTALVVTALVLSLVGCSPDEPIINSFDDSWRLLSAGNSAGLSLTKMTTGTLVDADVMATATGSASPAIGNLRRYRSDAFVLHASEPMITVLTTDSLRTRAVIDLGQHGPASDIAFVNATTAFATHPGTDVVSVIDLTTYTVADTIAVAGHPIGIAALGNQIGVVSQSASTFTMIDSRTYDIVVSLNVPTAPTFVDVDATNGVFVLVSLGAGKLDPGPATMPTMSFVNVATRTVTNTLELSVRAGQGAEKVATALAMSAQGYAFVSLDDVVLRVNTRSRSRATMIIDGAFAGLSSVPARAEILVLGADRTTLDVYDDLLEGRRATVQLPAPSTSLLGLAP